MKIAIAKEEASGETRVALTPEVAQRLVRAGHEVRLERGAGRAAACTDAAYEKAGATLADDTAGVLEGADVVARLGPPTPAFAARLGAEQVLVSFLLPAAHADLCRALVGAGTSVFAMDLVPRITRAQAMDALSSMSTIAGYRAALIAAAHLGKFFPMLMTAAGTVPPARVVVLGAGVAGLQAIATCRRLGAVVEAYDVRQEAMEQAASLGAEPIRIQGVEGGEGEGGYARKLTDEEEARLAERLAQRIQAADAVITTALVPGKPAPRLIAAETVRGMKEGAVVVDLAAETGGNCELTRPDESHTLENGVTLVGPVNLPATMPIDGSRMYAKNIEEVVGLLAGEDGALALDLEDEIVAGALAVHRGEVRHDAVRQALDESAGGAS